MKRLFIAISLIFFCISCTENKRTLANSGEAIYHIVFKGDSSKSQYKSAELLKKYLDTISRASFSIVDERFQDGPKTKIFVGNYTEDSLSENEIMIKTDGDHLYISGGNDEAIQNAVIVFLEKFLGIKWLSPSKDYLPNNASLKIDKDIHYRYTPPILTRTVHSKLFYDHPDFAMKHKVTEEAFPYYVKNAKVHTFHRFIPEEQFYKDHPEYFAMRNEKRLPTQLCLSNSDVFQIVKDSVTALFDRNPDAKVVSVSQDDNTQYCQCEDCAKIDLEEGSPSGSMIRFVNRIATNFPNKTISTLAYQYTRTPSKTKPLPNVLITLCSIECDRSAPIAEKCKDFANDLKGWGELTDNIRIWDYTTQFTNFLSPFPNFKTLKPNINLFTDNNAKWVFEQHSSNPSELFELRSYLMAKLLWDPNENVDDLITEFTDSYYEEAGSFVKTYVDLIHAELAKDPKFFLFLYGDPSQAFDSYLSPALLEKYEELFDQAEEKVASKPEVLKRVKEARLSTDYAILEGSKKNLTTKYAMTSKTEDGLMIENKYTLTKLEQFYETCKNANITLMNEMRFTLEEYYNAYVKTLSVAVKPNIAKGKKVKLLTKPKKYANEDGQVLTDGALGGNNFYANWLGFEGNHLEAVIDLEKTQEISTLSTAFLKVTNHVVFYPEKIEILVSEDGKRYKPLAQKLNPEPLTKVSKINEIAYLNFDFPKTNTRFIKIKAENMLEAPYWHHAAGLPSWIFIDEVIVN